MTIHQNFKTVLMMPLLAGVLISGQASTKQALLMAMAANGKQMASFQWKQKTTDMGFPSVPSGTSAQWSGLTRKLLPSDALVLSLDPVLAFVRAEEVPRKEARALTNECGQRMGHPASATGRRQVFKKYLQMKLQMMRESLNRLHCRASEQPRASDVPSTKLRFTLAVGWQEMSPLETKRLVRFGAVAQPVEQRPFKPFQNPVSC